MIIILTNYDPIPDKFIRGGYMSYSLNMALQLPGRVKERQNEAQQLYLAVSGLRIWVKMIGVLYLDPAPAPTKKSNQISRSGGSIFFPDKDPDPHPWLWCTTPRRIDFGRCIHFSCSNHGSLIKWLIRKRRECLSRHR